MESEEVMAAGAEKFGGEADTAGNLVLDRFFGEAEARGDGGLGESFEFVEEENGTGAGRERRQSVCEQVDFFLFTESFGDTGPIFQDTEGGDIPRKIYRRAPFVAEEVESEMARDGEKVGLGRGDGLGGVGLPDAEVGFLHHIVDIAHPRKRTAEVGFELGTVGMHLVGEPAVERRLGRVHGRIRRRIGGGGLGRGRRRHGVENVNPDKQCPRQKQARCGGVTRMRGRTSPLGTTGSAFGV